MAEVKNSHLLPEVSRAISEIVAEQGYSTTQALIDKARPKSSPIHNAFEWDDKVAAEEYRMGQSRVWHRKVRITIVENASVDSEPKRVRVVHVPHDESDGPGRAGRYVPVTLLRNDDEMFQRALRYALHQVSANFRAVRELMESVNEDDEERLQVVEEFKLGAEIMRLALERVKA